MTITEFITKRDVHIVVIAGSSVLSILGGIFAIRIDVAKTSAQMEYVQKGIAEINAVLAKKEDKDEKQDEKITAVEKDLLVLKNYR